METKDMKCCGCGIEKPDRSRDFFPLWFRDPETGGGWCPVCAARKAVVEIGSQAQRSASLEINMQAEWRAEAVCEPMR